MKKTNKLIMLMILLSACTTEQVPKPTISSSSMPTASISISVVASPTFLPTVSPKETAISTPQVTPSTIATPNISKEIKKVEIYDKRIGRLLTSSENPKSKDPKEIADFYLLDDYYYDLEVKVTYIDSTISSDFILKSSNELIANVDNTGRVFTHSTPDTSLFNLIILEKNSDKEIYRAKSCTDTGETFYKMKTVGTIYDTQNNVVNNTKITLSSLDPIFTKYINNILIEQPMSGEYELKFAPAGYRIEIEVSKEGYRSKKRSIVLKASSEVETFNFGGSNPDDKQYALEKI